MKRQQNWAPKTTTEQQQRLLQTTSSSWWDSFRALKIMQNRALTNPKIRVLWNSVVVEAFGEKGLGGLKVKNTVTGEVSELKVSGLFFAIGHDPTTKFLWGQLELDSDDYVVTKPRTTLTSVSGVFAAKDVQDKEYRQAVTAAGTGCLERFPSRASGMGAFGSEAQYSSGTSWSLSTPLFLAWNGEASSLLRSPELISWPPLSPAASLGPFLRWICEQSAWYEPFRWESGRGFWVFVSQENEKGKEARECCEIWFGFGGYIWSEILEEKAGKDEKFLCFLNVFGY